jgi:RNA polymerase sigma-70 factor (ECF subfamily)
LFRHESGRIVSHLARVLGPAQLDAAEEAVQEALVRALQSWPVDGLPGNPGGWLYSVAHNAALDAVRRRQTRDRKTGEIIASLERESHRPRNDPVLDDQLQDDELRMIFMCCHPDLPREARVALSLKTVSGFSVREIAGAFLADDATIAQRIVRAKRHIRDRGLALDFPRPADASQRLDSVLDVIYVLFSEGYAAHAGDVLVRHDLCAEALRLGRLIAGSHLATPAAYALVAFMALQAARLPARTDASGDLVLLEDQDRSRWDGRLIALGFAHFDRATTGETLSEYHIQAAIAATHARSLPAPDAWRLILDLYDQWMALNPSATVALNRAVVVAKLHGPAAGLDAIAPAERDTALRHYHLLFAVRGQFLLELGRREEAAEAFAQALTCRCTAPEVRYLERKLAECSG